MPLSTLQIDDRADWGGGQSQVLHLLKGLASASHKAELVTRPGAVLGGRARALGIKVHPVPMLGEVDLFSARRIAGIIRSGNFDIIHMHTARAHALGAMACAFNHSPACVVSRRVAFPVKGGPFGIAKFLKYRRRIDAYIAVCEAAGDALVSAGVDPARVHVVHSGVVPPEVAEGKDVREELGIGPDDRLVGNVGALVEAKDQHCLLRAALFVLERLPKAKFVIVGDGEQERSLKDLASELGVGGSVILTGFKDDVGSYLRAFDVFALSSKMEGLNNSVVEAMMMGKPVVATRVGGIPEIIEHEKTGLLVPPGDHAALAGAILDILENPEKAAALAYAGREAAHERFTAERMVEGTIAVYENLLKDRCRT